jgi:thioredoxin 2
MSFASRWGCVPTRPQAADRGCEATTAAPGSTLVIVTTIGCPTCNARNRVGPIARGIPRCPRCPRCKSVLPWVVDADSDTFVAETTASVAVAVVVDFWAAWCGPCRMISPVLEDLAERHAGHLKVVKVDVDAIRGLATKFGAQSIPLLVVIRDGKRLTELSARFLASLWSSGWGQCSLTDCFLRGSSGALPWRCAPAGLGCARTGARSCRREARPYVKGGPGRDRERGQASAPTRRRPAHAHGRL